MGPGPLLWAPSGAPGWLAIGNRLQHEAICHFLAADILHRFIQRRETSHGSRLDKSLNINGHF
jgi:hypothetical protein